MLQKPFNGKRIDQALRILEAAMEKAYEVGVLTGKGLAIVVMDPEKRYLPTGSRAGDWFAFEEAIHDTLIIRDGEDYRETAMRKAFRGWRKGFGGSFLRVLFPFYSPGESKWIGDFFLFGWGISSSGDRGHFDEMVSCILFFLIVYLCRGYYEEEVLPHEEKVFTD